MILYEKMFIELLPFIINGLFKENEMKISVKQFMNIWNDEMNAKHKNYISENNLNYYIDGVIAVSTIDKYKSIDYYFTDFNDIPEPYYSKVIAFCKEQGYRKILNEYSLDDLFKKSINMDLNQVKALIDKNKKILSKKEEIEQDFMQ